VGATPERSWCTSTTCDETPVQLKLPVGRQSGRLVVELTAVSSTASMHLVVYDSKDKPLPGQPTCCGSTRFVATRATRGSYTVVVYDDVGTGGFEVEVSWKANPPHRTTPTS